MRNAEYKTYHNSKNIGSSPRRNEPIHFKALQALKTTQAYHHVIQPSKIAPRSPKHRLAARAAISCEARRHTLSSFGQILGWHLNCFLLGDHPVKMLFQQIRHCPRACQTTSRLAVKLNAHHGDILREHLVRTENAFCVILFIHAVQKGLV